jgi:hypothetical protein
MSSPADPSPTGATDTCCSLYRSGAIIVNGPNVAAAVDVIGHTERAAPYRKHCPDRYPVTRSRSTVPAASFRYHHPGGTYGSIPGANVFTISASDHRRHRVRCNPTGPGTALGSTWATPLEPTFSGNTSFIPEVILTAISTCRRNYSYGRRYRQHPRHRGLVGPGSQHSFITSPNPQGHGPGRDQTRRPGTPPPLVIVHTTHPPRNDFSRLAKLSRAFNPDPIRTHLIRVALSPWLRENEAWYAFERAKEGK